MVGYDANYVEPLNSRYQCPACTYALRDPLQTECGHRLCKDCYGDLKKKCGSAGNIICPVDQSIILPNQVFPDTYAKREVLNIPVFCNYRENGCQWKGTIRDFEEHILKCDFEDILCPAECGKRVAKSLLEKHVNENCPRRQVECEHCQMKVPVSELQSHYNACEYCPIDCSFNCGAEKIPRKLLQEHFEKYCPNAETACYFSFCGCMFRGKREAIEDHLRQEAHHHLKLAAKHASQMEANSAKLQMRLEQKASEAGKLEAQVILQGNEINALKEHHAGFESQLKAVEKEITILTRQGKEMGERLVFLEGKSGSAIVQDVDNLKDQARQLQLKADQLKQSVNEAGAQVQFSDWSGAVSLPSGKSNGNEDLDRRMDKLENQLAVQDVQIAELNLKLQLLESTSYDGKLLWKIDNYNRRKQDAITGKTPSLYSPPFYTSRFGYKMCARIYLNGDGQGKGSHISLFFVVMRGEYDAMLDWPFPCKITMKLLSQEGNSHVSEAFRPDPNSSSFRRPKSEMNIASGVPLFVSQQKVGNGAYVKSNCIFVQVIVDTSTLRAPFSI
ncbi:TNF receptor-associated factor 3-like isoform X1 [Rhopilema esculentum]|uniref:TNF receptor-associated factor 3-like isoform X1 n=1 Tax=Rhopilema esculentum TaxID=499914 RepID=UPI0031E2CDFF